jgi:hypothetical protein
VVERARAGQGHLWLLLPAAALAALWLSWRALAMVDFLYPVFYEVIDIHGHIEEFAPQNRYKADFARTTPAERQRLFGEIVTAIHASGAGLAELEYRDPDGRVIDRLLREPEAGHLQDVADLVDRLAPVGWLAVAWTGIHLVLIRLFGWTVPSLAHLLGASLLATAAAVVAVLAIGPRRVFYWLHDLVFPPDHPWFFYYQDSLMSTMMKAPYLFGAIAVVLLLLGLAIYAALLVAARRLATPRA